MALPLKSGADLYNNQALRMRLHNLGADPTEVGAGLIYFNTSSGLNTSQKARLYTGSAWKTIAFSEDLDVAKNEDFLALQRRVDLIQGSVDTTDIIDNLTDVKNFLDGIKESDGDLMTMLNKKANSILNLQADLPNIDANLSGLIGGKLQSAEGTFPSSRYASGAFLAFGYAGYEVQLASRDNVTYIRTKEAGTASAWHTLLTSAGGTIDGDIKINSIDGTPALIYFSVANSGRGALGCVAAGPVYYDVSNNGHDILHSGNVGEYALKNIGATTVAESELPPLNTFGLWHTKGPYIRFGMSEAYNITIRSSSNKLQALINASKDGDWKTIAFTDSTVDKAKALVDGYGLSVVSVANSILDLNRNASSGEFYNSANMGLEVECKATEIIFKGYKTDGQLGGRIFLNSSGNVTIGDQDYARTNDKLFVDGRTSSKGYFFHHINDTVENKGAFLMQYFSLSSSDYLVLSSRNKDYSAKSNILAVDWAKGNLLVGTTTDDGSSARLQVAGDISIPNNHYIAFSNTAKTPLYQLWMTGNDVFFVGRGSVENGHESVYCGKTIRFATGDSAWNNSASIDENGNLHVKGNIIADGEVSAGGRAEEGGNAGSGAGAFHSESIAVGATQTTIAHGLGTDDIVVSIYEKDGVSGRWSIILTDVEIVDANNIIVSFGSATSVEHKVVIMGAVA